MFSELIRIALLLFIADNLHDPLSSTERLVLNSMDQRTVCLYLEKGVGATVFFEQVEGKFSVSLFSPDDKLLQQKASVSNSDIPIMFDWTAEVGGDYSFIIDPIKEDGDYAMSLLFLGDHQQRLRELKQDPRYLSVKNNLKPIRSIDPDDEDFSDLQPLKDAIGDRPYVFLGEQTHAEAESMSARVRLVKFLHQEMGFDVLVWESDLYSTGKVFEAIQKQDLSDDLWLNGFNVNWSPLKEITPIREYLLEKVNSQNPLLLWGVDGQFYNRVTRDNFFTELKALLLENEIPMPSQRFFDIAGHAIHRNYLWKNEEPPDEATIAMIRETTNNLRKELLAKPQTDINLSLWAQMLKGLSVFWEEAFRFGRYTLRDGVMADNFYWLAKKRFPDRKIIFWAASSHLAKNRSLERVSTKYLSHDFIPAGTIIDQMLPDQTYSIFCTALQGDFAKGHIKVERESESWLARMVHPNQHPDFELEEMMGMTDLNYGFLDFKKGTDDLAWLNKPAIARPFGHASSSAPWAKLTDSFFFIRNIRPVSYADWVSIWVENQKKKSAASEE